MVSLPSSPFPYPSPYLSATLSYPSLPFFCLICIWLKWPGKLRQTSQFYQHCQRESANPFSWKLRLVITSYQGSSSHIHIQICKNQDLPYIFGRFKVLITPYTGIKNPFAGQCMEIGTLDVNTNKMCEQQHNCSPIFNFSYCLLIIPKTLNESQIDQSIVHALNSCLYKSDIVECFTGN